MMKIYFCYSPADNWFFYILADNYISILPGMVGKALIMCPFQIEPYFQVDKNLGIEIPATICLRLDYIFSRASKKLLDLILAMTLIKPLYTGF